MWKTAASGYDFRVTKSGAVPPSEGRQGKCKGAIRCFQSPHSSCPAPTTTIRKFFGVSDLNPACFRLNHSSRPGMGEGDITYFCSQILLPSLWPSPFLGVPSPLSKQTLFSLAGSVGQDHPPSWHWSPCLFGLEQMWQAMPL